ncbi:MAG: peptidoglycan editing factor PgeF [Deltaproteobacteria bacterium]|jgi:YfiH family protein|nr:peptidoglycan editing factor PgeF [Deltaproteobacteria bacterium]
MVKTSTQIEILQAPLLSKIPVKHAFTTRIGGYSSGVFTSANMHYKKGDKINVCKNRRQLFRQLGLSSSSLRLVNQVHGNTVVKAGLENSYEDLLKANADGIISKDPRICVAVYTADCLPVLLSTSRGNAVAALHAGWRGIIAGIISSGVDALCQLAGESPHQFIAAIGPAIGRCCFETGLEVAQQFREQNLEEFILPHSSKNKKYIDLAGSVKSKLLKSGILSKNISSFNHCTFCDQEKFFSYRRDGWPTGQMLSLIAPIPSPNQRT